MLSFVIPDCHGQFDALPDSDAVWYTHVWDPWTINSTSMFYMEHERRDTIVNDTTYTVVWGYDEWGEWPGVRCGGVFDNEIGQTYYFHQHTAQAYLLSDFNVVVGDSVEHVWYGDPFSDFASTHTIYVVEVDTILIGNRWRKAIGIVGAPPEQVGYDPIHWWIEGIGGTGGLLETSGLMALDVSGGLECMSQGDSILWHWGPAGYPGNCLSVGLDEYQSRDPIHVSPNPSSGLFQVSGSFGCSIRVFDELGAQVATTTGSTIDLSNQPAGIYLALITSSTGRKALRLMVER